MRGGASRFFYVAKPSRRERDLGGVTNSHPTVKPIALMRYLTRLVTPACGVVLDPFAGSGTTGCAAVLEGFGFVGIEREREYVRIARRRIAAAQREEPAPLQ
jgi:site-specific DNA-methyltransferase (adenine-specific)